MMKQYQYVTIELENNKLTTAKTTAHRDVIDKYASEGFRYAGYVPCVIGPSGKILSMDLIFEKDASAGEN